MFSTAKKTSRTVLVIFGMIVVFLFIGGQVVTNKRDSSKELPTRLAAPAKMSANSLDFSRSRMIEAEPEDTGQLPAKDNAATDWRKAFALADKLTAREKEILKEKPPANPPATEEEIAALLAKIDPIILLLREGAAKADCDWGIRHLSVSTPFPHFSSAKFLANIAIFDCQQRISTQPVEAVQNLIAMDRLGNSLKQVLVGGLVNIAIHKQLFDFIALHATAIPASERQGLQMALGEANFAESLQEGFRSEMVFIKNSYTALNADGSPLTEQDKEFLKTSGNLAALVKDLERSEKMGVILDQMLYMPDGKFQSWTSDFENKNPASALPDSLPIYAKVRETARGALVSQGLAQAGLAVMDEGTTALARIRDPLTGKPFGYQVVDENGSFELKSEVVSKGKPVTLIFQKPASK